MSLPTYQNFIHGKPMANKSKETFAVTNPATGEVIYHVEVADEFIQQEAIRSAKEGFAVWSAMMPIESVEASPQLLGRKSNDEL